MSQSEPTGTNQRSPGSAEQEAGKARGWLSGAAVAPVALGTVLILLWSELLIDFSIGYLDTGAVGMGALVTLLVSVAVMLSCIFAKHKRGAFMSLLTAGSVIIGTMCGMAVTDAQFGNAQAYVEGLAKELRSVRTETGALPDSLSGLKGYDSSGRVPIGLLRRRRLHYSLAESGETFAIWFPYAAFTVARYDGATGKRSVDD